MTLAGCARLARVRGGRCRLVQLGDYFELNPLGTALAGRRSGRTYRLGDPIEVRVQEIRRNEGKVELSPAKP